MRSTIVAIARVDKKVLGPGTFHDSVRDVVWYGILESPAVVCAFENLWERAYEDAAKQSVRNPCARHGNWYAHVFLYDEFLDIY